MSNAALLRRIAAFDELEHRAAYYRPSPLILIYRMEGMRGEAFDGINAAVYEFMARALPSRPRSWADLLEQYEAQLPENVTPNGMVVPKRDTVLEYNLVVRAFARAVEALGMGDLVDSWHVPLNVRFKSSVVVNGNLARAHPTEYPHSDSWAGESTESVTVHIPIEGDWKRNRVAMFEPPDEFEEAWLGPRLTYAQGTDAVARRYRPVACTVRLGQLALMDFATLHASTRDYGCGPRVSIDTTFVLRKAGMSEKIHQWREGERASHAVINGIGETHLFYFPDAPGVRVEVGGGFKHPTKLRIINLQE